MPRHRTFTILCLTATGAVAVVLALQSRFLPTKKADYPSGLEINDAAAMRVYPERAQKLSVFRVTVDGAAIDLNGESAKSEPGGAPIIRVDLEVEGQHITVWIRDP